MISLRTGYLALLIFVFSGLGCSDDPSSSNTDLTGVMRGKVLLAGPDTSYADRSGIKVQLIGTGFSALTDINGNWEIHDVPTRTYDISFSHEGFDTFIRHGEIFVGGGVVTVRTETLYKIPPCPMILDDVRQETDYLRVFAHSACASNTWRDHAVFYLSNSKDVSSKNYSYVMYNYSQTPGAVIQAFVPIPMIGYYTDQKLRLEDSIYVVVYNSGSGFYVDDEGDYIYTSLSLEPSRRMAVLIKQ